MRDWQASTRKILAAVATIHAILLALLLTSGFVRDEEAPPLLGEEVFVAGLDDATVAALNLPPAAEPPAPETPPPPAPEPPQPEPPRPEPPTPEPPKPEPEPVKIVVPKPEPEPVKIVVPKPEPVPEPVLPDPEPVRIVVPKPEPVKPVPPKPEPVKPVPPKPVPPRVERPTPPKKIYRTAEEIRKSANFKPATTTPRPVKPMPTFDARSIAGSLQKGLEAVRIDSTPSTARAGNPAGSPGGSPNGSARNADAEQRWHAALRAELYRLWAQPTRGEVGGGNPTVRVSLKITADGQVVEARVVGASNVMPMDATIRQLLAALTSLPGFKSFGLDGASRSVTVTFKLTT